MHYDLTITINCQKLTVFFNGIFYQTIYTKELTYKFGKMYFGIWSPANPALITPDPCSQKIKIIKIVRLTCFFFIYF